MISIKHKQEFAVFILNGPNKSNSQPVKCLEHVVRYALILVSFTLIKNVARNWLEKHPIQIFPSLNADRLTQKTNRIGKRVVGGGSHKKIDSVKSKSNHPLNKISGINSNREVPPAFDQDGLEDLEREASAAEVPYEGVPPVIAQEHLEELERGVPPVIDQEDLEELERDVSPVIDQEDLEGLLREVSAAKVPSEGVPPVIDQEGLEKLLPVPLLEENLKGKIRAASPFFDLKDDELNVIRENRKELVTLLSNFFDLDPYGYIMRPKSGADLSQIMSLFHHEENAKKFAQLLYAVSAKGDSAYAEDLRTTLAGLGIVSQAVEKDPNFIAGSIPNQPAHPVSFASVTDNFSEAELGKSDTRVSITLWDHAIWKGYRDYRRKAGNAYKELDATITPAQRMDYQRRIQRMHLLHQEGFLVGRKTTLLEVKDFVRHRYVNTPLLSTTLFPKKNSKLHIEMFQERARIPVFGLFLDPTRVSQKDFGVSLQKNGETRMDSEWNFLVHKNKRIHGDPLFQDDTSLAASHLYAQKKVIEVLEEKIETGTPHQEVDRLIFSLNEDKSSYNTDKPKLRKKTNAMNQGIEWNEQTFNRFVEKDFFTAFFTKKDYQQKDLKAIIEMQERVRRKKGFYAPIFTFDNQLNEIKLIQ